MAQHLPGQPLPSEARRPQQWHGARRAAEWLALPAALALLVIAWWGLAKRFEHLDKAWLLPTPVDVVESFARNRSLIAWHTQATLVEIVAGFAVGFSLAVVLGYVVYRSRTLDRLLTPYIVASQAVPIIAVAPLLVIWLGAGMRMKSLTAALIVFFPMLVNTVVGLRNIDPANRELMRALSATPTQTLLKLEIPAAMPYLLAGLRVAVTLSVIGAVVGEFVGSSRGLGTLVLISGGQHNEALKFAALLTLVALALTLYGSAVALERVLLRGRMAA
ncbi:MAG: ABC transporter permease [Anaerolineae bacterium]|jgi:NitT/TauT family transport system permease protein